MGLNNTSENGSDGLINAKGDFILEHEPSGNTFQYDEGVSAWVPIGDLDLKGTENIVSVNSAELASINNSGSSVSVNDDLDLGSTQSLTNASSVNTDNLDIGGSDFVASGDFLPLMTWNASDITSSTSSQTYVGTSSILRRQTTWDTWLPSGAQSAVYWTGQITDNEADIKLINTTDSENVDERLNVPTGKFHFGPVNYTPSTTGSGVEIRLYHKNDNGNTTTVGHPMAIWGVQL